MGSRPATLLRMQPPSQLLTPTASFLEPLPSSNLLLPTKQLPPPAFIRQARAGRPQEVLCYPPLPPLFLLFPISTPSSQMPPYPPRTVLLSVSCLHGNNRGQVLGEEASGKCSFLQLPWFQFPNHHHHHSVLRGKVSELKS